MIGFDLLRPGLLWLLPLSLVLLAVGWLGLRRRRRELERLVAAPRLAAFLPGYAPGRARLRLLLASAAVLLIGFSALGPVRGYTERRTVTRGIDLVVCIDTSRSMLARDLRPDRLERAKREVLGLIDELQGDRMALIAFSGDARQVAPLTRDEVTLRALLDQVTPEDNRRGGTDLAAALDRALTMFDGRTGAHEAIVLLTDGEDLEGHAASKAEEAAQRGVGVYVVGVGTAGGGKIPIAGPNGSERFLVGPDGAEVVTKLDGTTLARIAQKTGGAYLSTEDSPTPLEDLYRQRITRIEGHELEGGKQRIPHDRYQWSLALAAGCMLLESGLRERRGRGRHAGGAA